MARRQIEGAKRAKFFRRGDLIVYGVVLAIVVVLLCVFLIPPKTAAQGVEVLYRDQVVFRYDFNERKETLNTGLMEAQDPVDGKLRYFFRTDAGEWNLLEIDPEARTAKVLDANCGNTRECAGMPPVRDGSGAIVCMPHRLIVRALADPSGIVSG